MFSSSCTYLPTMSLLLMVCIYFLTRYIAVEFASIWRGMGATVDLFFRKELPLRCVRPNLVFFLFFLGLMQPTFLIIYF